jgi:hypothetical protein
MASARISCIPNEIQFVYLSTSKIISERILQKYAVNMSIGLTFGFHMSRESSDHLDYYHVLKANPEPFTLSVFRDTIHTLVWTS